MPELTQEGQRIVSDLAQRHGFSHDAIQHMVMAVLNGNGQMAQFSHQEFAGSGQWMRGGMIMIGDMFNNYLKGRIDSLCSDISNILNQNGFQPIMGSFQSQTQSGSGNQQQAAGGTRGNNSLFVPDPEQNWWPQELGSPSATGSQNQIKYAYFAYPRRLAVKTGASIWVYDTQDHQIGGFSQQQGSGGSITFSSQYGTVNLASLPVVSRDGIATPVAPLAVPSALRVTNAAPAPITEANIFGEVASTVTVAPITESVGSSSSDCIDIFASIERLAELKTKGILTEEEFSEKKKELLSRL